MLQTIWKRIAVRFAMKRFVGTLYGMTQLLTNTVVALVDVTAMTSITLDNSVYQSSKTITL